MRRDSGILKGWGVSSSLADVAACATPLKIASIVSLCHPCSLAVKKRSRMSVEDSGPIPDRMPFTMLPCTSGPDVNFSISISLSFLMTQHLSVLWGDREEKVYGINESDRGIMT